MAHVFLSQISSRGFFGQGKLTLYRLQEAPVPVDFLCLFGCAGCPLLCVGFLYQQRAATVSGPLLLGSVDSRAHRLQLTGPVVASPGLPSTGSVVVAQGHSCSVACGIFTDQEQSLCSSTRPPGKFPSGLFAPLVFLHLSFRVLLHPAARGASLLI